MTLPVGDPANIVLNGGFEVNPGGWTLGGLAEFTDAFTVYEGLLALRMQHRRVLGITTTSTATRVMAGAVGATYEPRVRVRKTNATDGAVSGVLRIGFDVDNNGINDVTHEVTVALVPTNDWTELVGPTFVAMATTMRVSLSMVLSPSGIDADVWWMVDNLIVLPVSVVAAPAPGADRRIPPNGPGVSVFRASHFDEVHGILHKEDDVVADRYGRVRRRDDLDELATDDYTRLGWTIPTRREDEEP